MEVLQSCCTGFTALKFGLDGSLQVVLVATWELAIGQQHGIESHTGCCKAKALSAGADHKLVGLVSMIKKADYVCRQAIYIS